MKLRIASDLHFEFMRDGGRSMAAELTADPDYDVLVVAGDVASFKGMYGALGVICEAAGNKPVVYVLGNHEAYGGTWKGALQNARRAEATWSNLHVLEQQVEVILGQRFVGCTLWFPHSPCPEPYDSGLGDFHYIRDIYEFITDTAKASRAFLDQNVQAGDVVVTHHLPHPGSIHPKYARSVLNQFFLHDVSPIVEAYEAALWIHGHTHSSCDYRAGGTRVVCNPFGYAANCPGEPNQKFDGTLTVEITGA